MGETIIEVLMILIFGGGWVLVLLVALLIWWIVSNLKWRKQDLDKEKIRLKSERYNDILKINSQYQFSDLPKKIEVRIPVASRAALEIYDLNVGFSQYSMEHEEEIAEYAIAGLRNSENYDKYKNALRTISPPISDIAAKKLHVRPSFAQEEENKLCNSAVLYPITESTIVFTAYYRTPAGRNEYNKTEEFSVFKTFLELAVRSPEKKEEKKAEIEKQNKEIERSLMTASLRYEILKRDGFRCQLCGRTAKDDGVKLHVDHILPVSKGGQTTPENLRTLCQDCNLGKGDKYDEDGIN